MMPDKTHVAYEAAVERRGPRVDGHAESTDLVVVVTKTSAVTPVSNRGVEWSKQKTTTETTVFSVEHADMLLKALHQAFYFALDGVTDRGAEPRCVLTHRNEQHLLGTFWSVREAEERARELQATYDTPDFDGLTTRWADDLDHVVSVVERAK